MQSMTSRSNTLVDRFADEGLDLSITGYNTGLSSEYWGYSIWYWEELDLLLTETEEYPSEEAVCEYLEENFDDLVKEARKLTEQ